MGIQPVKGTEMQGAFSFRVLESDNDSIRIQFENHTNLSAQPLFLPSIGTDELYMVHPLTRSGSRDESDYMRSCARLEAGEAMLFPYLYHGMSVVLPTLITNNDSVPGNYLPANTR